jgi:hypothetical protein
LDTLVPHLPHYIWLSVRFENVLSLSILAILAHSDWRGGLVLFILNTILEMGEEKGPRRWYKYQAQKHQINQFSNLAKSSGGTCAY